MEKLQRMSDDPLKDCPNCEQPGLTKLVSASSFKLKGTGWYETDFKGGKKTESAAKASETKSSDTKTSGSKSSTD
jgi:putative FmdB family regulatory protein